MDDLADTVGTYQSVANRYEARHGDRDPVADQLSRFLAALEEYQGRAGDRMSDNSTDSSLVLDIGCGPGWESEALAAAGYDVLALDLTPNFLERTAERVPAAHVARMDMRELGVSTASASGIWACASFLHVPREDAEATLAGFARVLRPGGVLWLSVKRGEGTSTGDTYDGDERTFVLWDADELVGTVEAAGFDVERYWDEDWIRVLARG